MRWSKAGIRQFSDSQRKKRGGHDSTPTGRQRSTSYVRGSVGPREESPGDSWDRPRNSSDDQLHFMVQTMEAWFYADKDTLRSYFGQEFRLTALSQRDDIENIPRADVISGLVSATRPCESKGEYSKGQHSFQILELLDPSKVRAASPYADRLLNVLDRLS